MCLDDAAFLHAVCHRELLLRALSLLVATVSNPWKPVQHLVADLQVCGGYPDAMARCAQLLDERVDVDFVDINSGCPIDLVCNKCGRDVSPRLPYSVVTW